VVNAGSNGALWRGIVPALLAIVFVMVAIFAVGHPQLIVDEGVNVPQIETFMQGSLETQPYMAMVPGYHAVLAGLMQAMGLSSVGAMRVLGSLFGIAAAMVFYAIRRSQDDNDALWSALLFFVLPLFYPYYFLAYTDILSLLMVLLAVWQGMRGRHIAAAVIMTLSLAVRQNNIIWAAFLAAYAAWPAFMESHAGLAGRARGAIARALPYLLPAIAFVAYWLWNGAIVFSPKLAGAHPDFALRGGNVWFALLLFPLLFPAEAWTGLRSYLGDVRLRPWLLLIPVVAAAVVKLRGSGDNHAFTDYFIRNAFIVYVMHHAWAKVVAGFLVGVAGCAIAYTRFRDPRGVLVYPFSALCLASSVLIENRYAMVPFALWMAFRERNSPRAMVVVWGAVSAAVAYGILTRRFML
jgi:DIE2/ALG10 family.